MRDSAEMSPDDCTCIGGEGNLNKVWPKFRVSPHDAARRSVRRVWASVPVSV